MRLGFWVCLLAVVLAAPVAYADPDSPDANTLEQHLSIKNHAFVPQELAVPANRTIKLIIKNEDDTAAEFESPDLNREKVVPANSEITVYLDPLDMGIYPYFDDFHHDTTTGKIIAK